MSDPNGIEPWVFAYLSDPDMDGGERCAWIGCHGREFAQVGLCIDHATRVHGQMHSLLREAAAGHLERAKAERESLPQKILQPFVYYLMVGPMTVKIGTTTNLRLRMARLRTDVQYVVALELGGAHLENKRHRQFAAERFGRREDFKLSARLKSHIELLQPDRDELIAYAITTPEINVA